MTTLRITAAALVAIAGIFLFTVTNATDEVPYGPVPPLQAPVLLSSVAYPGGADAGFYDLYVHDNRDGTVIVYVTTQQRGSILSYRYNMAQPKTPPVFIAESPRTFTTGMRWIRPSADGQTLFATSDKNAFFSFNRTTLQQTGKIINSTTVKGAVGLELINDTTAIVTAGGGSGGPGALTAIDVSNPTLMHVISSISNSLLKNATYVTVAGKYVLTASPPLDGTSNVSVWDASNVARWTARTLPVDTKFRRGTTSILYDGTYVYVSWSAPPQMLDTYTIDPATGRLTLLSTVSASTSQLLRKYGNYLYSTGALSGTFRTSGIRIFDVASRPGRPSTAYIGPQDQVEARGMYSLGNGILFETEDTGSRLNVYQIGP